MGERKVLNKYISSDFDPSLIPRGKKLSSKDGTVPVRMMLPFSIQCSTCQTFLYRGRKFNSKKEPMGGDDGTYLGITRFRFYIKCTCCSRPITVLTDPKNADYVLESGGTRNYEVYKDQANYEESIQQEMKNEETLDPMKALEKRIVESQKEMLNLDNLEEIKALNAQHVKLVNGSISPGTILAKIKKKHQQHQQGTEETKTTTSVLDENSLSKEDEELIQSIQFKRSSVYTNKNRDENENENAFLLPSESSKLQVQPYNSDPSNNNKIKMIQRLNEIDEQYVDQQREKEQQLLYKRQQEMMRMKKEKMNQTNTATMQISNTLPILLKKKKRKLDEEVVVEKKNDNTVDTIHSIKLGTEQTQQQQQQQPSRTQKGDVINNNNDDNDHSSTTLLSTTASSSTTTTINNVDESKTQQMNVISSLLGGYGSSSSSSDSE